MGCTNTEQSLNLENTNFNDANILNINFEKSYKDQDIYDETIIKNVFKVENNSNLEIHNVLIKYEYKLENTKAVKTYIDPEHDNYETFTIPYIYPKKNATIASSTGPVGYVYSEKFDLLDEETINEINNEFNMEDIEIVEYLYYYDGKVYVIDLKNKKAYIEDAYESDEYFKFVDFKDENKIEFKDTKHIYETIKSGDIIHIKDTISLRATVHNISDESIYLESIDIVCFDKDNNIVSSGEAYVVETIQSNGEIYITSDDIEFIEPVKSLNDNEIKRIEICNYVKRDDVESGISTEVRIKEGIALKYLGIQ